MSVLRTALAITGWSSLGGAVSYTLWTRKSKIYPIPPDDYIFGTTLITRLNPYTNPVMHDVCKRKVPIDKIKPELLEPGQEGRLVEKFCAGVWTGWGFAYQKRYLDKKWRGPETATQLWDLKDLQESNYQAGIELVNHFEVVAKNDDSIIVRCGDSPQIKETRESDGLFEMTADVRREEGVVEFGLKSVFFNGLAPKPDQKAEAPLVGFSQWLHQQYDKVLMETAIKNCMK